MPQNAKRVSLQGVTCHSGSMRGEPSNRLSRRFTLGRTLGRLADGWRADRGSFGNDGPAERFSLPGSPAPPFLFFFYYRTDQKKKSLGEKRKKSAPKNWPDGSKRPRSCRICSWLAIGLIPLPAIVHDPSNGGRFGRFEDFLVCVLILGWCVGRH